MMLRQLLTRFFARKTSRALPETPVFVPIRDEHGKVTGVMDPLMAEYLQSRAPNPSQSSLDALFTKVTRLRCINGGMVRGKPLGTEVLLDVSDTQTIASLHACLTIVEDETTFGHCMCLGDQTLQLYAGETVTATIGVHHGSSIRWEAWKHDALLQNGRQLLTWLADRGVTGPLQAFEEDRRRSEEDHRAAAKWREAMPTGLLPFWGQMQVPAVTHDVAPLLRALEAAYPDPETRVLELFRWYGSGMGRWSGFPVYEIVAEELLLTFPTQQLVAALTRHSLTSAHLEGAARYFAGYYFGKHKGRERREIPPELKSRLLAHSLVTSDEDKAHRAKAAFGD